MKQTERCRTVEAKSAKKKALKDGGVVMSVVLTVGLLSGCSLSSSYSATSAIRNTVSSLKVRIADLAEHAGTSASLSKSIRAGKAYFPLAIDASTEDLLSAQPRPSSAIYSLTSDVSGHVTVQLFASGSGSRPGLFGDTNDVFAYACYSLETQAGSHRVLTRSILCPARITAFYPDPWKQF